MRRRLLTVLCVLTVLVACRGEVSRNRPIHPNPNMDDQPRDDPQEASEVFEDGRAQRRPVPGTVAREGMESDPVFYDGKTTGGEFVRHNPLEITEPLLGRGQERFNVYCAVCHGRVGDGKGIVAPPNYAGLAPPASYHRDKYRGDPDGRLYDVISNGYNTMWAYRAQIPERDRWAIVAYIRALQRSQQTTIEDVPRPLRDTLDTEQP